MILATKRSLSSSGPVCSRRIHPVYLAMAVGCGGMVGSWMNDNGFWVYARMGGFTEAEALKSWTPAGVVIGLSGLLATVLLAALLPLR